jgi:RNA polymerase sigma-70 factor (ECF subfamily)
MDHTPVSLLERLQQPGNEAAWQRFVQLYTPLLFHWAVRAGQNDDDAADLVQDVLAVLVRRLPEFRYDPGKSFHRWLYTVVMNLWRDRQRRKDPVALSQGAGQLLQLPAVDDLETFIEREYRDRLAAHALQLLEADFEPQTVTIFRALVLESQPAAEVATTHGLSVGAVYAAKFRVLTRLRQELAGLWK